MRRLLLAFVPLLLVPLPARATPALSSACHYQLQNMPNSTRLAMLVVTYADATGDIAVTTSVTCTVTVGTVSFTVTGTSAGPAVVATATRIVVPMLPVTVCSTPSAVFLSGPPFATTDVTGSTVCA